MSYKALAWAMGTKGLKPATKIILISLADRHNPDNGCFPSIKRISEDSEMCPKSVHNHINKLIELNLISKTGRIRKNGQQTSNEYKLHFGTMQNLHKDSVKFTHGTMQNLQTNNLVSINHVNEHMVLRSVNIGFEEFWKIYPRKIGKTKAKTCYEKATSLHGVDKINEAIIIYAESVKSKDKKYIPHPATWLNQGRWEDEIEIETNENIDYEFRNMVNDIARVQR
jgi:hypothetical protein